MVYVDSIAGRPVYAGGSSSVNIRENVTVNCNIIGNVAAGGVMGTATGNRFPDLEKGKYDWYEIVTSGGRTGYVREDVVTFTAPAKPVSSSSSSSKTSSGNGEYLKTAFDTESAGFPKWAIAAIALCLVLTGVAVWFLVKRKRK